jgi:hypothetical protein
MTGSDIIVGPFHPDIGLPDVTNSRNKVWCRLARSHAHGVVSVLASLFDSSTDPHERVGPGGSVKKAKTNEGTNATSPQPSEGTDVSASPSGELPRPNKRIEQHQAQDLYHVRRLRRLCIWGGGRGDEGSTGVWTMAAPRPRPITT